MKVADPRRIYWIVVSQHSPLPDGYDEIVHQWRHLAGRVNSALTNAGIPSRILGPQDPPWGIPGALITINTDNPFGVTIGWEVGVDFNSAYVPEDATEERRMIARRYRVDLNTIMEQAVFDILLTAGFAITKDHDEGDSYHYRVLSGPGDYPA